MLKFAGMSILALVISSTLTLAHPARANAEPVFRVMNTSETAPDGVWFRRSPHTADTDQVTGHGVYANEEVQLRCYSWGDSVGAYANTLWYSVDNLSRPTNAGVANNGFLNAHYIDDGLKANEVDAGVPTCDSAQQSPPPPPAFDRGAASAWALRHARDHPPAGTACTWFISQALWAGGLKKTDEWTDAHSHGYLHPVPGSRTAWRTPDFVTYIRATYPRSTLTRIKFRPSAVPAAQPGDVILYSWDGGASVNHPEELDHAALVVDIASGQYPEVSEWSADGDRASPYKKRGWSWSELSHKWLQTKYPHVQAFLLHIDAG